MSTVDVVVPCYNYARFLPSCVESVLSQAGVDVRVLIVDDCSPDNTAEVGKALAAADSRVTYVRNEVNSGLIKTANRGLLEWAAADYSLLLSADDALSAGALARAVKLMDENPRVGMVYGLAMVFGDDQQPEGAPQGGDYRTKILSGADFIEFCCRDGNHVPTPTAVVRTSLQQEVGRYSAELPHTSDYEMWMRFALRADVGVIEAVQGYYRRHASNMSGAYLLDRARDLRECMKAVDKVVAEAGGAIVRPERLLEISKRRCAVAALHAAHRRFDAGDAAGSEEYVAFAEDHGVSLGASRTGRTLQVKRMIGRAGYRKVAPILNLLRGNARPAGAISSGPEVIGLWPKSG